MRCPRVKHASGKVEIIKATFYAIAAVLLAFPIASFSINFHGGYQGIFLNGQLIGVCNTEAEARQAYLDARLHKNQEYDGLAMYDVDVTFGEVTASSKDVQSQEELTQTIYAKLDNYQVDDNKQLAYTMKISGYTVTLASKEDVVDLLDQVQAAYDTEGRFQVELSADDERESNAMTVVVKEAESVSAQDVATANVMADSQITDGDAGDEKDAQETDSTEAVPTEEQVSTEAEDTAEAESGVTAEQYAATDGVIGMDFDKTIQVSETYVSSDVITDTATALADITQENVEKGVYEVKVGDCLSTIAEQYGMSTSELLSMNDNLTADSNILVGDEIVVTVPETPLSVVVSEQKTYTEEYDAEVQYIDDDTAYQGTETVVQEGVKGERIVTAIIEYTDGVETGREVINEEIQKEAVAKIVKRGTKVRPTYIKPISGGRQTSGFGMRWGKLHKGVDWACSVGTTVHASRSGRVVSAGWNGSYGYSVLIDHGDGVQTRYAHLSKISVSAGQYVNQGDTIGKSGSTGRSTGPHLHFEIIINGTPVNPLNYL